MYVLYFLFEITYTGSTRLFLRVCSTGVLSTSSSVIRLAIDDALLRRFIIYYFPTLGFIRGILKQTYSLNINTYLTIAIRRVDKCIYFTKINPVFTILISNTRSKINKIITNNTNKLKN